MEIERQWGGGHQPALPRPPVHLRPSSRRLHVRRLGPPATPRSTARTILQVDVALLVHTSRHLSGWLKLLQLNDVKLVHVHVQSCTKWIICNLKTFIVNIFKFVIIYDIVVLHVHCRILVLSKVAQ